MAKPSIFSRDYERRMKKRRRRILIIILITIVIGGGLIYKFKFEPMDFTEIRNKIQAWVDSGKQVEEEPEEVVEPEPEEELPKEPEKKYIDLNFSDTVIIKAEYEEQDGKKYFVNVEPMEGMTFNISPSKEKILVLDQTQSIKIFNINGEVKDVTKTVYISSAGTPYTKDSILATTPDYIWHSQVKFIDDNKIVFVSQLPFFGGAATNKYVWIKDVNDDTEKTLWDLKGVDVVVGDLVAEKGINITIDGNAYYVNADSVVSR